MVHASLFSGIGGFDLAAEIVGWENAFSCEIDPFCNHVLKFHFPNETQYNDIRRADFSVWRGRIDVLSGGFPCQPFSQAGKRKGTDDDRHLWPAMLDAIRAIRPRWVVGENVLGIVNWNAGMVFESVCADLEAEGYQVQPFVLPACGVDAPHRRYRTFFIAYRHDDQCESGITIGQQCGETSAAESCHAPENTLCDGWSYDQRKEKSGQRQQRNVGAGNHERVCLSERDSADSNNLRSEDLQTRCARLDSNPLKRTDFHGGTSDVGLQRTAANPAINGDQPCGTDKETERNGRSDDGQSKEWRIETQRSNGLPNLQQLSADSDNEGLEGAAVMRIQRDERRTDGFWDEESAGDCGQGFWADFPTQSPVCGRDDGFSEWLDPVAVFAGITPSKRAIPFNRWRSESIKAYGNAVVVPLIVQIFRVINLYMKLYA